MDPVYARFERAELVLELEERLKLRIDTLGRWLSYRDEHALYRRLLSGRVAVQGRHVTDAAEPVAIYARVTDAVATFRDALSSPRPISTSGRCPPGAAEAARRSARAWLDRAAAWTETRYAEQAELFRRTYPDSVPILPPDRSRDLVVLPALGCPYARCRFCAFYGESTYQPLTVAEFSEHLDRVAQLLGPGLDGRTGVFLGSANALALAQPRLLAVLTETRSRFGQRRVSAFWDPDHSPHRAAAAFSQLFEAGLSSVYVGLETGSPKLRSELGKSADVERFSERVRRARQGGLRIGVSVLAGIAGDAAEHEACTAHAVHLLGLDSSDSVFVSPLMRVSDAAAPHLDVQVLARSLNRALTAATPAQVASYAPERHRYAS
jgi:hypothetical protein